MKATHSGNLQGNTRIARRRSATKKTDRTIKPHVPRIRDTGYNVGLEAVSRRYKEPEPPARLAGSGCSCHLQGQYQRVGRRTAIIAPPAIMPSIPADISASSSGGVAG